MPRTASRLPRFIAARSRRFWAFCFLAWLALLWWLSSHSRPLSAGPAIPHFDKICHFLYFFFGAIPVAALLSNNRTRPLPGSRVILLTTLVFALVGWLDEWHQSHTPQRYGNDPFDWLADLAGAFCGACCLRRIQPHPQGKSDLSQFA